MTTVRLHSLLHFVGLYAAGKILLAMLVLFATGRPLPAQGPNQPTHWLHAGVMPPGAIGSQRLLRGGPLSGYVQPVKVYGSQRVAISAATGSGYAQSQQGSLLVGLQVGGVYSFAMTGVPNHPEAQVYATVEVIDRLYPPCGKELKFPIPVQLTDDELKLAATGAFVTRVIYVEDPRQALPIEEKDFSKDGGQQWFEARTGEDPLVTADMLGRPVAILRIGSRRPHLPRVTSPPMQLFEVAKTPAPAAGGTTVQ